MAAESVRARPFQKARRVPESDPEIRAQLEEKLAQARRLLDMALDNLTITEILKLVAEIEEKLTGNNDVV